MKISEGLLVLAVPLMVQAAIADDLTINSAIGGGIGGALGGAVGAQVGGRDGAIIGSGVGAAVGTAIATNDHKAAEPKPPETRFDVNYSAGQKHPHGRHCPPGQGKKGRC